MKKIIITSIAALTVASSLMAGVNAAACAGCHGKDWGKKAMGKSMIVKDMSHADIEARLLAFKAKTAGTIMKGQVARYSEADLKAFAQTIGK